MREVAGIGKLRQHAAGLLGHLERNQAALVHYAARRRRGEPIATSFAESAWTRSSPGAADALEQGDRAALPRRAHSRAERHARGAFRRRRPGFRPANDGYKLTGAAA